MGKDFFERFFEEKKIPEITFQVEGLSGTNYIPVECVIDAIKQAPTNEKKAIENTLRKIDFLNGNVVDYLRHLAQALAI